MLLGQVVFDFESVAILVLHKVSQFVAKLGVRRCSDLVHSSYQPLERANTDLPAAVALPLELLVDLEEHESSFELIYFFFSADLSFIVIYVALVKMLGVLHFVLSELIYFLIVFVIRIINGLEPGLNELGHLEVQIIQLLKAALLKLFPINEEINLLFQEHMSFIIPLFSLVSLLNISQDVQGMEVLKELLRFLPKSIQFIKAAEHLLPVLLHTQCGQLVQPYVEIALILFGIDVLAKF